MKLYYYRDEPEDMYEPPPPDMVSSGPPLPSRDSIPPAPGGGGGGGTSRRISAGPTVSPTPRPPITLPPRRLPRPEIKEEAPPVPPNNDLRAPSVSSKDRSSSPSRPSVPRRNYVDIVPQPRPPIPPPVTRPPIPPVSQQFVHEWKY